MDNLEGRDAVCPKCFSPLPAETQPAPLIPASQGMPNRTILAEPEAMVRYTCARCKKSLESPAAFAGRKLNCPSCNQRLQIPQTSTQPAAPPINKTILAAEVTAGPAASFPLPQLRVERSAPPPIPVATLQELEPSPPRPAAAPAVRRESCLECGADLTERQRVQTCADCGSLLCSANCQREHRHHAHSPKKRPRSEVCYRCGSTARPYETTVISQAGWITFALLLVFFFPLFWIGLLITEKRLRCYDCNAIID